MCVCVCVCVCVCMCASTRLTIFEELEEPMRVQINAQLQRVHHCRFFFGRSGLFCHYIRSLSTLVYQVSFDTNQRSTPTRIPLQFFFSFGKIKSTKHAYILHISTAEKHVLFGDCFWKANSFFLCLKLKIFLKKSVPVNPVSMPSSNRLSKVPVG